MAARNILIPLNLNQNELQNVRMHNLASAPSSPVEGQPYYDTVLKASYVWNGTAWRPFDAAKLTDGTIANSALTTNPLARANHTGTQTASTISDFATTAQGYRLDQHATAGANIPMGGFKFTGLATPTTAGDSAEYSWVIGQIQSAAAGIASKPPVRLVATAQRSLSGLAAIDSVTPIAGDRILLTGQTTPSENGVYTAASGSWARTTVDGAAPGEIEAGALWLVTEGTANAGTQWRVSTTGTITIGSTSITIVQFGAGSTYTAGNGITLTGSSFSVNPASGGGISVAAGGVSVDTTIVARKFSVSIGDGSTLAYVVTHNLGTQDVVIFVRAVASPFAQVECDVAATSTTTATITFASAPASNAYRVTVLG